MAAEDSGEGEVAGAGSIVEDPGGGSLRGGVRFGIIDDFGIVDGTLQAFSLSIDTV